MDTKQINDALDRVFHQEEARIVFWNDPEREFLNDLPFLLLDGVTTIRLDQEASLAVKIRLEGDSAPPNLPLGAGGAVAIYTNRGKPVHIISKVTVRMKKWLLYVIPA